MSLLKLVLYQVELPTQLYLKYNGVEYRGDRNDIIVAKSVDHFHSVKHSETFSSSLGQTLANLFSLGHFDSTQKLLRVGDRAIFHCIATGGVPRPQASGSPRCVGWLESIFMFRLSCSWQAEMSRESRERAEVRTGTPFVLVLRSAVTIPINFHFKDLFPDRLN